MSEHIEVDGRKYFEESYVILATNSARRAREKRDEALARIATLEKERNSAMAANRAEFDGHKLTIADHRTAMSTLEKERASLERRAGELTEVLRNLREYCGDHIKPLDLMGFDYAQNGLNQVLDKIRKVIDAALASTPREGTEEPARMSPTETLAKLLTEANAEMVFRHSDVHPLFVSLNADLATERGDKAQLTYALGMEESNFATERAAREALEKERDALAAALTREARANLGLRQFIHRQQEHNQWMERCESGWCNPGTRSGLADPFGYDDPALAVDISSLSSCYVESRLNPDASAILVTHDATIRQEARRAALVEMLAIAQKHETHEPEHPMRYDCRCGREIVEELTKMAEGESNG